MADALGCWGRGVWGRPPTHPFLAGLENGNAAFLFLSSQVDLSYRASFLPHRTLHPEIGMGWEFQQFFIGEAPIVRRGAPTLELGLRGDLKEHWSVGGHLSTDFAIVGDPGFGMTVQAGVWYRF